MKEKEIVELSRRVSFTAEEKTLIMKVNDLHDKWDYMKLAWCIAGRLERAEDKAMIIALFEKLWDDLHNKEFAEVLEKYF